MLLEAWRDFEKERGTADSLSEVEKKMPKKIIKKRAIATPDGMQAGYEEYYDYVFPSEESAQSLKILERARLWKKQKATGADEPQL